MPQSNSCFLKNRSLPFKRASPQRGGRQRQATTSAAARRGLEAFYPRLASMMEAAGCDVGSRRGRKESKYDVSEASEQPRLFHIATPCYSCFTLGSTTDLRIVQVLLKLTPKLSTYLLQNDLAL